MERKTQKRQGDNWAVSQTLEAVLLHVNTMGELAGEKQTKIHAKISTKTSGDVANFSSKQIWSKDNCTQVSHSFTTATKMSSY